MARVALYGQFADRVGWRERDIEAADLGALRLRLTEIDPWLGEQLKLGSTLVILNDAIGPLSRLPDSVALTETSDVGFGPPVSGG